MKHKSPLKLQLRNSRHLLKRENVVQKGDIKDY